MECIDQQAGYNTLDHFASSHEAAQSLCVTPDHIGRLCRAGDLECRKFGGAWYVTLASLDQYDPERGHLCANCACKLPRRNVRGRRAHITALRVAGKVNRERGYVAAGVLGITALLVAANFAIFLGADRIAARLAPPSELSVQVDRSADWSAAPSHEHMTTRAGQLASAAALIEDLVGEASGVTETDVPASSAMALAGNESPPPGPSLALATDTSPPGATTDQGDGQNAISPPSAPTTTPAGQLTVSASWLTDRLNDLRAELLASVPQMTPALTFSGPPESTPATTQMVALSNKIDRLSGTAINSPTITGGTISDASVNASSLNVSGNLTVQGAQALSGALTVPSITATSTTATSTFAGDLSVTGTATFSQGHTIRSDHEHNLFMGLGSGVDNDPNGGGISGKRNNAFGYQALQSNTTGRDNNAFGMQALQFNTTGVANNAFGLQALQANTTGVINNAFGQGALMTNTSGGHNLAFGWRALGLNTTGNSNVAIGNTSMEHNVSGSRNVAIGHQALLRNISATNTVAIGYQAGLGTVAEANENNIFLGYRAGTNVSTGSNNILIGYDAHLPAGETSNFLSIGNLIFGTGIDGTGTTLSSGNVGIGTTTPSSKLTVAGTGRFTGDLTLNSKLLFPSGVAIAGGAPHADATDPASHIVVGVGATTGNIGSGGDEGHIAIGKGATTELNSIGTRTGLIAIGLDASADSLDSMAIGYGATASNNRATALGRGASAIHTDSTAVGQNASASNANSIAIGRSASASGNGSTALGHSASAAHSSAIALGRSAATSKANQLAIGSANIPISEVLFATSTNFVTASGDLTLSPAGNVGIGTTSPGSKLEVSVGTNNGALIGNMSSLMSGTALPNITSGIAFRRNAATGAPVAGMFAYGDFGGGQQSLALRARTDISFFVNSATQSVTMTNSGRVGIGTTDPDRPLHIRGAGGIRFDTSTDGAELVRTETNEWGISPVGSLSKFHLFQKMYIDNSSGNIGIGTSTPTAQLHTTGTVRFANFGAGTLETDASGNVTVASDEMLKDAIEPFKRSLEDLMQINPITFRWRDDSGMDTSRTYSGFSAQNVQQAVPEAVGTNPDGALTLSERPILAAAVNAIKELAQTVSGFAERFATRELSFERAEGDHLSVRNLEADRGAFKKEVCVERSDGAPVCITGDELAALLAGEASQNTTGSLSQAGAATNSTFSTSTTTSQNEPGNQQLATSTATTSPAVAADDNLTSTSSPATVTTTESAFPSEPDPDPSSPDEPPASADNDSAASDQPATSSPAANDNAPASASSTATTSTAVQ